MAQTVSGSYMISSTNEFGTHYLAFVGTSLTDATTFNPATCIWDVAITNGTCTVSMDGNYLTMSGTTVGTTTTIGDATTFTISDGKLMAGGNYLVFDDEWKAVDNSGYKCYLSSPAEGIPYMISYNGNYLGYHVKADGKNVEIINETSFNPATCIWYLTSDNKLRTNVLTVNNQQKIYYLKVENNKAVSLQDQANNGSTLTQNETYHWFYISNNNPNKYIYLIYNDGWKGKENDHSTAGVYSQLEIYSITDGAKYLGVNGSLIEYSTTASQWFAETSGAGKTLHQGSNYLTLGTTLGSLPGIAATGTEFDLTDNHIYNGTCYLGYRNIWTGNASATGAATLTGPSKSFVFTYENNATEYFMTINSSGSIANVNLFHPNTCVWTAIPSGTGGYYMAMASGGNMYYLMGNGATLSTTTSIASATAFNISGHIVNYRSTNNKTYSITCNKGTWGLSEKAAQAVYFELESHYTDPEEATGTPSVSITVLDSISGNYFETSAHTLADLGRYYFHADVDGMAYPGYMTYNILNSPYSIRTYYMLDGGTACITELPMPGTNPNTTWSLQNLNSGTALSHLHYPTSGFNNDFLLKYGTWGDSDVDGWGSGNTDYVRGEPQQVKLTYTFNSTEASGLTAEVILTVKAPTWKDYVISAPTGFPYYDPNDNTKLLIRDEKDMAWVISVVNSFNGATQNKFAGKTICLTKDLDLGEYQWCPFSEHENSYSFQGNFDGRGHIIKNLRCSLYAIPGSEKVITTHLAATRGFIGNYYEGSSGMIFENTFFENVEVGWPGGDEFQGHTGHHLIVGGIIAGSDGTFTVKNCGISGRVFIGTEEKPNTIATAGAITGYVSGGTIESCYSVAEVDGINVGGLVGCLASGSVKNCLVNPIIKIYGAPSKGGGGGAPTFNGYAGGIVGQNGAVIENCYVRLREGCAVDEDYFGLIAGQNTSTINYCYVHKDHTNVEGGSGTHVLVADDTQPASYGLYNNTIPYKYEGLNNTLTKVVGSTTYAEVGKSLLDALNSYVEANSSITTRWARTTSDINEDYPILRFDDFNNICSYRVAVNHDGPDGPTDELLDPFMYYKPTLPEGFAKAATYENGAVVALYKNEDIRETAVAYDENKIKFYIDEEASLLHDDNSPLDAYVGVTFRNAVPGLVEHDAPENCYWHMLSTPLDANSVPLGIDYNGDDTQYNAYPVAQDNLPQFGWITEGDKTNNGYFPDDTPYGSYDFYSWYEPEYQWVNFKRNGPSHWHEDTDVNGNHAHFDYTPEVNGTTNVNESYLIPGKGYLMAVDKQLFLQSYGMLNEGDITYPITCSAAHIPGYNFIGNPYHSYLDIEKFFDKNESQIWLSESSPLYRQIKLINGNEYVDYTIGASKDAAVAPQYINMHQGFLVVADKSGTVTFTNAMRSNSGTPDFREAKINYPLINLHVTDENGYGEVAVVEVGRPERGGARKAHEISRANCILYAHQGDEDYSVLFLEEGISSTGVWFEPFSDGQFTMKWDTHNGTFDYLHLIDNIAGVDIDCTTTDSYTFQSSTSDYKSRFKLVFSYTGVEENVNAEVETFAFQSGDNLIVNGEGRLEIIDMNGRLISATELYGAQNAIAMPNVAQGVYLLRQISNNNVKVQKIVVR